MARSLKKGPFVDQKLILKVEKNIGDDIQEEETVVVLEAMKMETTIKTPTSGKIKNIFIKNGDKVQSGDPLFEVV